MFAYNPIVTDRSGEILAQAKMQENALRASDQQQMWQGIGEGISSIGEGLGQMIQKKQEDAAKATSIGEALNTMQATLPTYGPEGLALQEIVNQRLSAAGNNLDKMSGVFMAVQPAVENLRSRFNQQSQFTGALELAKQKQALGLGGGGSTPMYGVEIADGVDIYR